MWWWLVAADAAAAAASAVTALALLPMFYVCSLYSHCVRIRMMFNIRTMSFCMEHVCTYYNIPIYIYARCGCGYISIHIPYMYEWVRVRVYAVYSDRSKVYVFWLLLNVRLFWLTCSTTLYIVCCRKWPHIRVILAIVPKYRPVRTRSIHSLSHTHPPPTIHEYSRPLAPKSCRSFRNIFHADERGKCELRDKRRWECGGWGRRKKKDFIHLITWSGSWKPRAQN